MASFFGRRRRRRRHLGTACAPSLLSQPVKEHHLRLKWLFEWIPSRSPPAAQSRRSGREGRGRREWLEFNMGGQAEFELLVVNMRDLYT
jgi:hypothetical protein